MKVYIVEAEDYDMSVRIGVFKKREDAEKALSEWLKTKEARMYRWYNIDEVEVE